MPSLTNEFTAVDSPVKLMRWVMKWIGSALLLDVICLIGADASSHWSKTLTGAMLAAIFVLAGTMLSVTIVVRVGLLCAGTIRYDWRNR